MGKLFDSYTGLIETPAMKYLKDRDFYESTMNPRFTDAGSYNLITKLEEPCLRKDIILTNDRTLRIFINAFDIYYEIQNGYRSLDSAARFDTDDYDTVDLVSELLDEILSNVL